MKSKNIAFLTLILMFSFSKAFSASFKFKVKNELKSSISQMYVNYKSGGTQKQKTINQTIPANQTIEIKLPDVQQNSACIQMGDTLVGEIWYVNTSSNYITVNTGSTVKLSGNLYSTPISQSGTLNITIE